MTDKRLVFVINHVAFFASHRLSLALGARKEGWEVILITGQAGSPLMEALAVKEVARHGLTHKRAAFRTVGWNPIWELIGFAQLLFWLRQVRPGIVHTASPKGNLYGGLAARLARVPGLVIAISGMGFLFTGKAIGVKAHARNLYAKLLRWVYRHPNKKVIVQNHEDEAALLASGLLAPAEVSLIPGSGVELKHYLPISPSAASTLVVLPARLLRDKGVEDFVAAARHLRKKGCSWRFALVGTADYRNPSAVRLEAIHAWVAEGVVEWWGHREDMPAVYEQAGIVCLPSHREGMPKCLLEAAAAGRPVVTSDVAGCRDAVVPGETGDLVPLGDTVALADTLQALMDNPDRRARYGQAAREMAIQRYSLESVVEQTLSMYQGLISNAKT